MTEIKKFRLGDICDIEPVKKCTLRGKSYVMDKDIISKDGTTPYIAAISINNGITGYSSYAANNKGDCITLSTTADSSNTVFYQEEAFIGRQQIAGIRRKDSKSFGLQCGLYMVTVIKKHIRQFNYANKLTVDYLQNIRVPLPVTPDGTPDWDYMQNYIAELEQNYIAELEQNYIAELEQYLIAAGLNDYTLTDEDIRVLEEAKTKEMREFRVGDLFEKTNLKWTADRPFKKKLDLSTKCTLEFNLPLCNAKDGDNGIMYYGRSSDFAYVDGGLDIVSNGAVSTGNVYPQPHKIGVLYDAYVVVLKNGMMERKLLEYLACATQKAIKHRFGYDNKATWDRVKICSIILPVQAQADGNPTIDPAKTYHPDGYTPDWNFMSAYIRATEKLVIQDVVDYKNTFITHAKVLTQYGS